MILHADMSRILFSKHGVLLLTKCTAGPNVTQCMLDTQRWNRNTGDRGNTFHFEKETTTPVPESSHLVEACRRRPNRRRFLSR